MNENADAYWLDVPLSTLGGDCDDMSRQYGHIEGNDEVAVRDAIRAVAIPYVRRFDADSLKKTKNAYRFFLSNREDTIWDAVYSSMYMPFDPPTPSRLFFVWLWEEMFPGESWKVDDLSGWTTKSEPRNLRLAVSDTDQWGTRIPD